MEKKIRKASVLNDFYWKDYLAILLGTLLYAIGITQFIVPHQYVTGGATGAALLINYASEIPVSISIFVINGILLAIGFRQLGTQFLIKTIIGTIFLSLFIGLMEAWSPDRIMKNDPLVAGILGAILCGGGVGLVFSVNGSTGGTDILVAIIGKYHNVTPGRVMLFSDLMIISSSFFVFKSIETIVYGIIILAVMTYTVDMLINGVRQSVQILIISPQYEKIADAIVQDLQRGCTVLDGRGWYSKSSQKVVMVLAKRTESMSIFRMVKSIDENAFISQSTVIGVYGEGFDKIK